MFTWLDLIRKESEVVKVPKSQSTFEEMMKEISNSKSVEIVSNNEAKATNDPLKSILTNQSKEVDNMTKSVSEKGRFSKMMMEIEQEKMSKAFLTTDTELDESKKMNTDGRSSFFEMMKQIEQELNHPHDDKVKSKPILMDDIDDLKMDVGETISSFSEMMRKIEQDVFHSPNKSKHDTGITEAMDVDLEKIDVKGNCIDMMRKTNQDITVLTANKDKIDYSVKNQIKLINDCLNKDGEKKDGFLEMIDKVKQELKPPCNDKTKSQPVNKNETELNVPVAGDGFSHLMKQVEDDVNFAKINESSESNQAMATSVRNKARSNCKGAKSVGNQGRQENGSKSTKQGNNVEKQIRKRYKASDTNKAKQGNTDKDNNDGSKHGRSYGATAKQHDNTKKKKNKGFKSSGGDTEEVRHKMANLRLQQE